MNIPLVPCPFCGGAAKLDVQPESYGTIPRMVGVVCTQCGANTPKRLCEAWTQAVGTAYHTKITEAEVIDQWNRRAAI